MTTDYLDGVEFLDATPEAKILREAKIRWKRAAEWESTARMRFIDDIKFENGDSDNGYQWPYGIRKSREVDSRPCLTMNVIRQHNLMISNAARKNKSSAKYVPQGNGATVESAQIMSNIVRRIEMQSNAQSAYTLARSFQIGGGIGWWRLHVDYVSENTFDQDIWILPIKDPLSVYMDPNIRQKNGKDARWAFVFDNIPKEQFREEFPQYIDRVRGTSPLGAGVPDNDWVSQDYIRVCEYFRVVSTPDVLVSFVYQGARHNILKSKLSPNMMKIIDGPLAKKRSVMIDKVEWYLIAGDIIIDQTEWVGKHIPLVRCIGEENVINGIMDRKGHTRNMKDAQRMLNYNASSQVEFVALQGKTPWIASAQAIEEYETMWNTANNANHSVLIFNGVDDGGNAILPPQRTQPPTASPAYEQGMQTAFNQMMMVSGQWQNSMGMAGNERTGAAIQGRMAQAETSVYHFQDNYEDALVWTGTQLLDLIPKVYDTKRVISVQAEDETTMELMIDPKAAQAFQVEQQREAGAARRIFNPTLGEYAISPAVGPSYGSKRQQTTEALSLLVTQAPQVTPIIGDLLLGSMDFDKAAEAAQRLKRMVPPQALGEAPNINEITLQKQVQSLSQALAKALQQNGKDALKLVGKDQMRDIDVYEAQTKRLAALKDTLPLDQGGLLEVIQELIHEAVGTHLSPIINANKDEIDDETTDENKTEEPPMPNAKKAPDGQWYVPDPTRPGKHLKVHSGSGS